MQGIAGHHPRGTIVHRARAAAVFAMGTLALPLTVATLAASCTTVVRVGPDGGAEGAALESGSGDAPAAADRAPDGHTGKDDGADDAPGSDAGVEPRRCVFDRDGSAFDKGCTFGP